MLPLEIMGVQFAEGNRKDGSGRFAFTRILVKLNDAWFEVIQNGKTDLQPGDTGLFDLVVRAGRLALVYTGQRA